METQLWAIGLVILAGLIGAFGPIYLKEGAQRINFKILSSIFLNKYLILGILVYAIGTLLFIPALRGGELSVLYPLVALSYVWLYFYSRFIFKKKMPILAWIGLFVIVASVALIGLGA